MTVSFEHTSHETEATDKLPTPVDFALAEAALLVTLYLEYGEDRNGAHIIPASE